MPVHYSNHLIILYHFLKPPPEYQSPSQRARSGLANLSVSNPAPVAEKAQDHEIFAHGIETRAVFDGSFVNKKYGNEMMHRSRFCWIDPATKRFYWSKTEGKSDPKKKSLSLVDDIATDGISLNKNKISIVHSSNKVEESINLEIVGTADDVAAASDWYKVLISMHKGI